MVHHDHRPSPAVISHFPPHPTPYKAQRRAYVLRLVLLLLRVERGRDLRKTTKRKWMTLRNNWARSPFESFLSPLNDASGCLVCPLCTISDISCFLEPASLPMPTHTCMHTISAKSFCRHLIFSLQHFCPQRAYYCLMINRVAIKVYGTVLFMKVTLCFVVVIYVKHGHIAK